MLIKILKIIYEIINTISNAFVITLVVALIVNYFEFDSVILISICSVILDIGLSKTIKNLKKDKEEKILENNKEENEF